MSRHAEWSEPMPLTACFGVIEYDGLAEGARCGVSLSVV